MRPDDYIERLETRVAELEAENAEMLEVIRDALGTFEQQKNEIARLRGGWDEAQTYMALSLEREERLRAALREIREMVDRQAEDEGLWFIRVTASEAYLQQELRSLHDRVERLTTWP
jgi:hypothetical protein